MATRETGKSAGIAQILSTTQQPQVGRIFAARVSFVILNNLDNPLVFKQKGEWSSIGGLFFNSIKTPNITDNYDIEKFAKPLFPNNRFIPTVNEIVYILTLPNENIQTNVSGIEYYYFQPVNIWNSCHHNAIPNPIGNVLLPESQKRDYEQIESGSSARKVTDKEGTEINLGKTFKERIDVKNLQPYEGDNIYEGRWGNSIRLGSTVLNSSIANRWSSVGTDGDPIIIIRNGQHNDGKEAWIPQVENINEDKSSIYLTSTQKVPIKVSSTKYDSYKEQPPTKPLEYAGEQVIINSGRLVFNSNKDHILISSKKSIGFGAQTGFNFDTPSDFIVNTGKGKEILLGSKDATEPIILGNKFLDDFSKLLQQIINLSTALKTPIGTPTPFIPNSAIPVPATTLSETAKKLLNSIETYKSKVTKSK